MEQKVASKRHSRVVGGSTAKRVMACPGSVNLCTQVPPKPSSSYADEGTLLHEAISICLDDNRDPKSLIGMEVNGTVLTEQLMEDKLKMALDLFDDYLDVLDADKADLFDYAVESEVSFGKYLPDVFGSCDVIARVGDKAIILDWKFGQGVPVEAEENAQLLFYGAAARRTEGLEWFFDDVTAVELVIVQPPYLKRWETDLARLDKFEKDLKKAVKLSKLADAPMQQGDHCRWCAAKSICPLMTGAVDRALQIQLRDVDIQKMGRALSQADLLEQWIADLRALAHQALEAGVEVTGWKLVEKRATRKWVDEEKTAASLSEQFTQDEMFDRKLKSPAQMEKLLKKSGMEIPEGLVVAVSSGTTIAPEDDPRPKANMLGQQLGKALGRLSC